MSVEQCGTVWVVYNGPAVVAVAADAWTADHLAQRVSRRNIIIGKPNREVLIAEVKFYDDLPFDMEA